MKNFILVRILRYIGGKFDGHKTRIAGLIPFLHATISLIGVIYPEYATGEADLEQIIAEYTGAFGIWGIGGKLEKTKAVLKEKVEG